jgi:protein-tyrosine phosphatase
MDGSNYLDVIAMASNKEEIKKVIRIMDEVFPNENLDVPDPYYGGSQGFENVYRMLDQATDLIANKINK